MVQCSEEYGSVCPLLNFGISYEFCGTLAGLKADPFSYTCLELVMRTVLHFPCLQQLKGVLLHFPSLAARVIC